MIRVRNLHRRYTMGDQVITAVDGVDLELRAGESVALLGPSGSGKSTLMHLLGALDTPDAGTIEIEDGRLCRDIGSFTDLEAALYRSGNVGFVFQSFHLQSHLTALENVALPLKLAGAGRSERHERARHLLTRVGLGDRLDHRPNELSGGQQQRVSIARALAVQPRILLADEPTGNLDSKTGEEVMALFLELQRQEGLTLVIVTHDPDVAARAERVVKLRDGKIESITTTSAASPTPTSEGETASPESGDESGEVSGESPEAGEAKSEGREGTPPKERPPLVSGGPAAQLPQRQRPLLRGLRDDLGDVWLSILRHPLRTALTAFGIAVGGLAISLMVGLGIGLHDFIQVQAQSINDPLSLWVVNTDHSWQDIVRSRAQALSSLPVRMDGRSLERLAKARSGFEEFDDARVAQIKAIPGVTDVRPRTFVIMDGVRLVPPSEASLDPAAPAKSNRTGGPREFEGDYFVAYTLVRGFGTQFRIHSGDTLEEQAPRGVVLSYQFTEAWGMTPAELIGRELEIIFPDLTRARRSAFAASEMKGRYRSYRAKVVGLTEKSILASAIFLTPKFGEEVKAFQFSGGLPDQSQGGGFELFARLRDLTMLAREAELRRSLAAGTAREGELGALLGRLEKGLARSGGDGGLPAFLAILPEVGRLRALSQDTELQATLAKSGGERARLGKLLAGLFPKPGQAAADAKSGKSRWGSRIRVRVRSEQDLPAVKAAIHELGCKTRSLQDNLEIVSSVFAVVDALLSSFGLIALFVAALGIANTLIMAVYERTREIGVMKAVGATESQIRRLFALEAAAIGFLGGVLGTIMGAGVGYSFNAWGVTLLAPDWKGFAFFVAPLWLLGLTLAFCTLIGFLAGLYPAWRAARLDPIVALRTD